MQKEIVMEDQQTKKRNAFEQGPTENAKERKTIIKDEKYSNGKKAETETEKEAAYKHENGNPQALKKADVQHKQGQNTNQPIEQQEEQIGADG